MLLLTAACSGGGGARSRATPGPLDRLDLAVRGLSTARNAALDAAESVQAGASALDATDAVCATGKGVAARTSYRAGAPAVRRARTAVKDLPGLVRSYRGALAALAGTRTAVSGRARAALDAVGRDGAAEADALAQFGTSAAQVWPRYDALDAQEALWIKRAVTPWYRSTQEGANAYAVLVGDDRKALVAARTALGSAAQQLSVPTATQSDTLAAADRALATVRDGR